MEDIPIRSIDIMKWTKDRNTSQCSDQQITNIVTTLKNNFNITHIGIACALNPQSEFESGHVPTPSTIIQYTQKWCDAIHNAGLKVLFRGDYFDLEDLSDVLPIIVGASRISTGTTSSASTDGYTTLLGRVYQYITSNPTFFASGDIWAPMPERNECNGTVCIFTDAKAFLADSGSGVNTDFRNFFVNVHTVSDAAFSAISKTGIITGMTAYNFSEVSSGWMLQGVYDDAGKVVFDHYGTTHTTTEMNSDHRTTFTNKGYQTFQQEWGDYWNNNLNMTDRLYYLKAMYNVFKGLADDNILYGFNYWGGWDGSQGTNHGEHILDTTDNLNYTVNGRGKMLARFLAGDPVKRIPVNWISST